MKSKKGLFSLLLVVSLLTGISFINTDATEQKVPQLLTEKASAISDAEELPTNDELFEGYIQKQTYYDPDISWFAMDYASEVLDEFNYQIYSALKENIIEVAKNGGSTKFTLNSDACENLKLIVPRDEDYNQAFTDLTDSINLDMIVNSLLVACAYELYWYDKTLGTAYKAGGNISDNGEYLTIEVTLDFAFSVAAGYLEEGYAEHQVTSDVSRVNTAIVTAKSIVEENKDKTDRKKLTAYKEKICELTSYNDEAAGGSFSYGDPWQLISVFDGDEATEVVCEGYSKAFQYLCEVSDFYDDYFASYLVTGDMLVDEQGGPHMWNLVTLGGVNYLVDVTNSDAGTIGMYGGLFLALNPSGGIDTEFTVPVEGYNVTYTYSEEDVALYGADIRQLGLEATYSLQPKNEDVNGTISLAGTEKYFKAGTEVGLQANGNRGYRLNKWLANGEEISVTEFKMLMPNTDIILTAQFILKTLGDLNDDLSVDALDINILRMFLIGDYVIEDDYPAYVNEDNAIDVRDVVRLKKNICNTK